ncbi:poly(A)-specific ribonuclease PARN [Anabrus simplex]|uniref:poly(A)-specific ribonuclease PARN n=1 Tax=Anabrus simplex TaxID=316456 RepID=UPI0034DD6D14
MEVTRSNFLEVLPELEDIIKSAEFLTIDGEFTGLNIGSEVNAYDTPAQYYSKIRAGCMDFLLVQLGLCAFSYDKENDKFTHRAYNFYVFPRPFSRSAPDHRFLCQSSSIAFLISQGFDFNKTFKEGIPYLRDAEEKKLRENLEEKIKARANSFSKSDESPTVSIPEEFVPVIEDACTRITEFLAKGEPEEITFDRCNAFVRKLIYQTVGERFDPNSVHLETRTEENQNRVLVVTRNLGEEARKKREEEKDEQDKKDLEAAVGITHVIRLISQSGKLIVGHNMLLDLCHIVHQFCTPLPESYIEFKDLVSFLFPRIIDTKFMSCSEPFRDHINSTVLGHLLKTLSEEPFEKISADPVEKGQGYNNVEEKSHEAGYDAYITGLCFLSMCSYLGRENKPRETPVLPSSPLLKPFLNRMHLMRLLDLPYIHLGAEDPNPSRQHVFYVNFPKEWKTYDLTQLFSPFGGVSVAWINDTSAYVGLHRRDQAGVVLRTLTQSDTYTVIPYVKYQKILKQQQEGHCTCSRSKHRSIPCSPTTVARKRRSLELLAEETNQSTPVNSRRKRSRGSGDYSKRSIEPIPEEAEVDDVISTEAKRSKDMDGTSSANGTSVDKKEFEEDDTWG